MNASLILRKCNRQFKRNKRLKKNRNVLGVSGNLQCLGGSISIPGRDVYNVTIRIRTSIWTSLFDQQQ